MTDWKRECSICKGPINTATDNYVCFGHAVFKWWGPLGNVCADCVIDAFEIQVLDGDIHFAWPCLVFRALKV